MIVRTGVLLIVLATGTVLAQTSPRDTVAKRSALAGVIRDTLDRPLPMATVLVDGKDLQAVSDDSGRFHLAGIPAGSNDFTVMRIGYKSVSFTTTLAPDTTLVLAIHLRRIQTLEEIEVSATGVSPQLKRQGFYERRAHGLGTFLTPERVDSLYDVATPSQLLRDVRGIELQCGRGSNCIVATRRAHGCLNLFIDGTFTGTRSTTFSRPWRSTPSRCTKTRTWFRPKSGTPSAQLGCAVRYDCGILLV